MESIVKRENRWRKQTGSKDRRRADEANSRGNIETVRIEGVRGIESRAEEANRKGKQRASKDRGG